MTFTELRYIVAVARYHHFGRAAEACFVSQPTLSVAVRKLEDELDISLFERRQGNVTVTTLGQRIIEQAQRILEEVEILRQLAQEEKDPLSGALHVGIIYTIGPYLTPHLIPLLHESAPQMRLIIREDFTVNLTEALKQGELDVIIISLPFAVPGIQTLNVYDEPFLITLPNKHPLAGRKSINPNALADETMLLLGAGNCFRDQVLEVCPDCHMTSAAGSIQKTLEGSSLETIRQMVATGAGITVLPATTTGEGHDLNGMLTFRPFTKPVPSRTVALAWRKSFPRQDAIDVLKQAIYDCPLPHISKLKSN